MCPSPPGRNWISDKDVASGWCWQSPASTIQRHTPVRCGILPGPVTQKDLSVHSNRDRY
jgi:hypothetical protein